MWFVVRCEAKNEHQNDTCLKKIETCAQILLTILGSIDNTIK